MNGYSEYLSEKCLQTDLTPTNLGEMEIFFRNIEVRQSISTPNLRQIKMFATTELAELCIAHRNARNSE